MFTTLVSQRKKKTFPFHDSHRIYTDEHDIAVHGCGINPLKHTSVALYDLPQRRWYELNIDQPMPLADHEEWFEQTVLEHISTKRDFNVIHINRGVVTYSTKDAVGRPLHPPIVYAPFLPTVNYTDVTQKKYLRLSVDTCHWNGIVCLYKQLEFDEDIGRLRREIACRERLLHRFGHDAALSEYGICPILGIVVDEAEPLLCGILMPRAGTVLDQLTKGELKIHHLISLVNAGIHLRSAQVVHGDICERNVCIQCCSVQLIDFGEIAPRYENDIVAIGRLFLWCLDHFSEHEQDWINRAARELIDREDIDAALAILKQREE